MIKRIISLAAKFFRGVWTCLKEKKLNIKLIIVVGDKNHVS